MANPHGRKLIPGDLTWVQTRISLWWPAMVVDENYVSKKLKPKKRSASQVLVREYGSYTYSYVDPVKTYPAFQTILKKNNGSLKEVLEKYMKQDISRIRTGSSKRSIAESRESESMGDASEEETVRSGKKKKLDSPGNSMGDASEEETGRSGKKEKLDSPGNSMGDASEEETGRSGKKEKLDSPGNSMGDATEEETPRSEKMKKLGSPGPVSST